MDCSPPDSSVHGIFQASILEWDPFPSVGDLPDPGIEPESPTLQADSLLSEPPEKPTACIRKFLFLIVNIFETWSLSKHVSPTLVGNLEQNKHRRLKLGY